MSMLSTRRLLAVVAVLALIPAAVAWACPFCSAVSQTFTEEINTVNVAVIAKLVESPPAPKADADEPVGALPDVAKSRFEIVQVLKGQEAVGKTKEIEVLYFGQQPKDTKFLILGIEPPDISWNAPVPLTERAATYIGKLLGLPEKGADRLAFFQDYFEDKDELLARDAYDEFAKAPYDEVKDLKDRMKHDQLVAWIKDSNVLASRRRLYLTMLGVCGGKQDVPMLEELITREEPGGEPKSALDALIACYLTLNGPDGMPLIEDRFLKDEKAEYTDTYSAIMALRFHGQEEDIIPKKRLVEALRHMLDRPQMADLVIPDLARWEDWESMDKLVKLFKEADDKSSWVRVPVVQYLKACPLPEAEAKIEELAKIDPESVKRASFFVPLGPGKPMTETKTADDGKKETDTASAEKPVGDKKSDQTAAKEPAKTEASGDPLVPPAAKSSAAAKSSDARKNKADKPAPAQPAKNTSAQADAPESDGSPKSEDDKGPALSAANDTDSGTPSDTATMAKGSAADSPVVPTTTEGSADTVAAKPVAPAPATAPVTAQPVANTATDAPAENSLWLIFVPLGVGLVLLMILLIIVRGGSGQISSEV